MTIVNIEFDDIHFPESNISGFRFSQNDLIVDIESGLEIYGDYPSSIHKMSDPCRLVFKNVSSSKRMLDIYAGDPKIDGFRESKTIVDDLPMHQNSDVSSVEYIVEGVLIEPKSWLTWFILAQDFYFDDLKDSI
jgi:hypothetical protein